MPTEPIIRPVDHPCPRCGRPLAAMQVDAEGEERSVGHHAVVLRCLHGCIEPRRAPLQSLSAYQETIAALLADL